MKHSFELIRIAHTSGHDGDALCARMELGVRNATARSRHPVVLHDATDLQHATEPYARRFGASMKKLKPLGAKHVAIIPRPLHRMLAHVAAVVAVVDIKIFKERAAATAYLASMGIDLPSSRIVKQAS